jgi:hypothetical protein
MYADLVKQYINIPFYTGMHATELGLDSLEHCPNRQVFKQHPSVTYQFNEIGFRTHNVSTFNPNAILVLGDSFTLGLGVNNNKRYADLIEQHLSHQVLNFSLNGASNDWIARKLQQLLTLFHPSAIIVHYTFSHRRERPESAWFDDERTECEPFYSSEENFSNWFTNFKKICLLAKNIKLVHSFIPNWHDQAVDYDVLGDNVIPPLTQSDKARDNFHYGPQAHQDLANAITSLLDFE